MFLDKYLVREVVQYDETPAIILKIILDYYFKNEWYDWDLTTIYLELRSELQIEAPEEIINKIAACQGIMASAAVFESIDTFMAIMNTLGEGTPSFTLFDPVTGPELCWGITEISLMRELLPFGPSVKIYIKRTMDHEGVVDIPAPALKALGQESDDTIVDELLETGVQTENTQAIDEYIDAQLDLCLAAVEKLNIQSQWRKLLYQQELINE